MPTLAQLISDFPLLLADRSYSISWALILLSVILGLLVTLRPARRSSEVKKPPRN